MREALPYSFTSLPELSQRLRRPGPPLPPAGPAPRRARQPRRHPALRRALPGRKGLQASDCRRANGLLPAAGRGPDALRMVPLPENTQKNHGGWEVFPSLQNLLHSALKWGGGIPGIEIRSGAFLLLPSPFPSPILLFSLLLLLLPLLLLSLTL